MVVCSGTSNLISGQKSFSSSYSAPSSFSPSPKFPIALDPKPQPKTTSEAPSSHARTRRAFGLCLTQPLPAAPPLSAAVRSFFGVAAADRPPWPDISASSSAFLLRAQLLKSPLALPHCHGFFSSDGDGDAPPTILLQRRRSTSIYLLLLRSATPPSRAASEVPSSTAALPRLLLLRWQCSSSNAPPTLTPLSTAFVDSSSYTTFDRGMFSDPIEKGSSDQFQRCFSHGGFAFRSRSRKGSLIRVLFTNDLYTLPMQSHNRSLNIQTHPSGLHPPSSPTALLPPYGHNSTSHPFHHQQVLATRSCCGQPRSSLQTIIRPLTIILRSVGFGSGVGTLKPWKLGSC